MAKVNLSVVDDGDDLFDELIRTREQVAQQVVPQAPQVVPQAPQVVPQAPTEKEKNEVREKEKSKSAEEVTTIVGKEQIKKSEIVKHKAQLVVVRFKIEEDKKDKFQELCASFGYTMTETLKEFISQSVRKGRL